MHLKTTSFQMFTSAELHMNFLLLIKLYNVIAEHYIAQTKFINYDQQTTH